MTTTAQRTDTYANDYLSLLDVANALRISRFTVYRLRKDPAFPRFFNISPGRQVISRNALDHWLRHKELESITAE